jgi:1-acyl-sn-glycerol-3-phosphate acyltransferase
MPPPEEELAPMKEQVYKDPRPAEYFTRYHEQARSREPDWVYEVVRVLTTLWGYIAFRARCLDAENVLPAGKVIVAPNHFSFMDHFLVGMFLRRRMRFMAKSQLFSPPMEFVYTHGGVLPVRRGARDEEAFITAEGILQRGGVVTMYPEAGRSRTGKLADQAKPGVGRLALESGAPVVPVAIFGSHKVRNWKKLQFPKVTVQFGEPLTFPREADPSRERQQEVADAIFDRVKAMHAGLAEHGRRGIAQRVREQQRALRRAKRRPAATA